MYQIVQMGQYKKFNIALYLISTSYQLYIKDKDILMIAYYLWINNPDVSLGSKQMMHPMWSAQTFFLVQSF